MSVSHKLALWCAGFSIPAPAIISKRPLGTRCHPPGGLFWDLKEFRHARHLLARQELLHTGVHVYRLGCFGFHLRRGPLLLANSTQLLSRVLPAAVLVGFLCSIVAATTPVELSVDTARPAGAVDLTRYALGQGGLSHEPMFDAHVEEIAVLRPQTIRLFVQEYFNLYPEHGRYHWDTLDRSIENILATGAKPLLCLCFKPRVLYPEINHDAVIPTDYAEWDALIAAMVRHCNREKRYGIEYWEVGNEVDIGESGGCPYRFKPPDYTNYYAHTANAILRADPAVKVGGPALASHTSPIGDALMDFCGKGGAPLHFFSWHIYSNDPQAVRGTIRAVKQKLARYPRLAKTETILDEWNIGLLGNERTPGFQSAFVLECTAGFLAEGLSRSSYYHIRDHFVAPEDFTWMSPAGYKFMADWWNVQIQNSGLFDKQGRRRPAYYVFQMLAHLQGRQLPVAGGTNGIQALAVRNGNATHIVCWNFPLSGPGVTNEVMIRLPRGQPGQFRLTRLNAVSNRLDMVRTGAAAELDENPLRVQLAPYGVAWAQVGEFKIRASWGHRSPSGTPFYVKLLPGTGLGVTNLVAFQAEAGEKPNNGVCRTKAGGGDIDGVEFDLTLPSPTSRDRRQEQSLWGVLLKDSDPDTARRLRKDPAFEIDPPLLTFQMNAEGTRGFSVTLDQLMEHEALWIPEADLFVSAGDPMLGFGQHQRALAPLTASRVLDRVHREGEATYAQYTNRWEDMGNPGYQNPFAPPPGHVICLTWDSAIPKFGIDRSAGILSDLGTPERFKLSFDFVPATWKSQRLTDGLPVVLSTFERDDARFEVEQFAYPLRGPPSERRGDIEMMMLQKLTVTELSGKARPVQFTIHHTRDFPAGPELQVNSVQTGQTTLFVDSVSNQCLLSITTTNATFSFNQSAGPADPKRGTTPRNLDVAVSLELTANGQQALFLALPSPVTEPDPLLRLDYTDSRSKTLQFWSDYLARGAVFHVPEAAVNELFRANLWHALSLPRRHGGAGTNVAIDLPYSNFAYGQTGTPWPVNQAVYVDYMLYDLRGYHDLSREELLAQYRDNQEANGHVGGFANWGVYTPAMLYSVAQHYLLSHDLASFYELLPPTLKALDWCLAQLKQAAQSPGPAQGLILAPLNDLSHDARAWAFNQAYFFAGVDLLGRALSDIRHWRAAECRQAAHAFSNAVARAYGRASMLAPVAELRDHTWTPYVPSDALTPRRLPEVWYPTDVDTGPLHLSRLKALDPKGELTTTMLNDHEDNLFYKSWSMADEPVYNQHATAYLLRDDPEAAIRAFYSMMACAFSHTVFEPVEHRWGWGQYFGPPSTDGAWFELYRQMLIRELDDGSLLLGQATPRAWLQDGKKIEVQRAPTYSGPLSLTINSHAASGKILASVHLERTHAANALFVRLRHPSRERIRSATVKGKNWKDCDPGKEWVRISQPSRTHYEIEACYTPK